MLHGSILGRLMHYDLNLIWDLQPCSFSNIAPFMNPNQP